MPINTLPPIELGTRLTNFGELDLIVEGMASGGMGLVVWGPNMPAGNSTMAVKLVDPQKATSNLKESFEREALHWCSLWFHPNLIHAIAMVRLPGWNYLPVLAIEYAPNGSLAESLEISHRTGTPLPLALALAWAQQIASALAAMHAPDPQHGRRQPLIHCDLKPGNILVGADGDAKVTDLGLARIWAQEDATQQFTTLVEPTAPVGGRMLWRSTRIHASNKIGGRGPVVGTIPYMPPEQWQGAECIVPASDMYAFGIILFQLFAGVNALPHMPASPTPIGWFEAHAAGPSLTLTTPAVRALSSGSLSELMQTPLSEKTMLAREALQELDVLVQSCLEIDPASRPTANQALDILNYVARRLNGPVIRDTEGDPHTQRNEWLYWGRDVPPMI